MRRGYTHTTITAEPDGPLRVSVGFCLDEHAWIETFGRADSLHLWVQHGDCCVRFSPVDRDAITEQDARLARKLATAASTYAGEVEHALADQQAASPAA